MEEAKRVVEQMKRTGEFDRYRQEILSKLADSSEMKTSIDECSKMVDEILKRASKKTDVRKLRETLKNRLELNRNLTRELYRASDELLEELACSSRFNDLIESLVRNELGIADGPGMHVDRVDSEDMDVSSGATSSRNTSSTSSSTSSEVATSHNSSPLAISVSPTPPSSHHQSPATLSIAALNDEDFATSGLDDPGPEYAEQIGRTDGDKQSPAEHESPIATTTAISPAGDDDAAAAPVEANGPSISQIIDRASV